ncbi:hypothetical protein, partial [Staphylococcus pseudintermedius]|uniref:hypothetical protein n=1 Tax=Staphylococcus pseudintermedius TaxID=283734 RepID=UPI0019D4139C
SLRIGLVRITHTSGNVLLLIYNGHPCLSLTFPITNPVTDFHRQVVLHAMRTKKASYNFVQSFKNSNKNIIILMN